MRITTLFTGPVLVAIGSLVPSIAAACSCGGTERDSVQRMAISEVVFHGRAKAVRVPWLLQPAAIDLLPEPAWVALVEFTNSRVLTEFDVLATWKGVETSTFIIDTGVGWCCDCSFGQEFSPGDEALFFTDARGKTGLCNPPVGPAEIPATASKLGPAAVGQLTPLPAHHRWGLLEWVVLITTLAAATWLLLAFAGARQRSATARATTTPAHSDGDGA